MEMLAGPTKQKRKLEKLWKRERERERQEEIRFCKSKRRRERRTKKIEEKKI